MSNIVLEKRDLYSDVFQTCSSPLTSTWTLKKCGTYWEAEAHASGVPEN